VLSRGKWHIGFAALRGQFALGWDEQATDLQILVVTLFFQNEILTINA